MWFAPWIGNKRAVAAEHYLQVTDTDFERAAESGARAMQNAVQSATAQNGNKSQNRMEVQEACRVVRNSAGERDLVQHNPLTPTGFEPVSRP